jgi:hypothetical protein
MHDASICFKCFQVYHTYIYKCFICICKYMFAMIFKYFLDIFASVSDAYFKCFICLLLKVALQLLHRDVSKVDRALDTGYT